MTAGFKSYFHYSIKVLFNVCGSFVTRTSLQLIFTDKLLLCLITDSTRLWGNNQKKVRAANLSFDTDIDAELSEAAKVTIRPVLFAHGNSNKKL